MKQQKPKLSAGLWLDNHKALIISKGEENGDYAVEEKIMSENDSHMSASEHTQNQAKKGDMLKYFKQVSKQIIKFDDIYVFGTGKSQEQFHNFLKEDALFNNKKITVDSAGNLEEPQMVHKVKEFFK